MGRLLVFATAVLSLGFGIPAFALGKRANYSRGFCVLAGEDLKKEKAIVVVDGNKLNGSRFSLYSNHRFFDPNNSIFEISAYDGDKRMLLMKVHITTSFDFLATYENNILGYSIPPTSVRCIADDRI